MADVDAQVEWMSISGDPGVWRSIGLTVSAEGIVPLFGTGVRIVEGEPDGIVGWAISGIDTSITSIAGLATDVVEPTAPSFAHHALGALELDHVVVMSGDLESTTAAIADATGCELKRIREVGLIRQGFHRIGRGGLIVEVVQHEEDERTEPAFWGLVMNVEDLDSACALIGEGRISSPKDAVQPGRRIATISRDVGLGLPLALMSRDPR